MENMTVIKIGFALKLVSRRRFWNLPLLSRHICIFCDNMETDEERTQRNYSRNWSARCTFWRLSSRFLKCPPRIWAAILFICTKFKFSSALWINFLKQVSPSSPISSPFSWYSCRSRLFIDWFGILPTLHWSTWWLALSTGTQNSVATEVQRQQRRTVILIARRNPHSHFVTGPQQYTIQSNPS